MQYDRIKFEELLFQCWSVVDELRTLREAVDKLCPEHLDKYLAGLEVIYSLKFDRLQKMFEASLK